MLSLPPGFPVLQFRAILAEIREAKEKLPPAVSAIPFQLKL